MFFSKREELYLFSMQGYSRGYTSGDETVLELGTQFRPLALKRTRIVNSVKTSKSDMSITVPRDLDVAQLFLVTPPSEPVRLKIFRKNKDGAFAVIFNGIVLSCGWRGLTATLTASNKMLSLSRTGLRKRYQVTCPYALYGVGCNVNVLER